MIYIEPGVYVFVKQQAGAPGPRLAAPESGFSEDVLYRVLGVSADPESGDCLLILANDRNEIRLVPNSHARFGALDRSAQLPRIAVNGTDNVFPIGPCV